MKITDNELRLLSALRARQVGASLLDDAWETVPGLQNKRLIEPDHSPQGIHQTGASLVRKGLAEKKQYMGLVYLRITPEGADALRATERR